MRGTGARPTGLRREQVAEKGSETHAVPVPCPFPLNGCILPRMRLFGPWTRGAHLSLFLASSCAVPEKLPVFASSRDAQPPVEEPEQQDARPGDGGSRTELAPDARLQDATAPDAGSPHDSGCGLERCAPIVVESFPFEHSADTRWVGDRYLDRYSCSTNDEGGPEVVYEVRVPAAGILSAELDDVPEDPPDMDLHLLRALDSEACAARANVGLERPVAPGVYFLVVDTWVDSLAKERVGPYRLKIDFVALPRGACEIEPVELEVTWPNCPNESRSCHVSTSSGGQTRVMATPSLGSVRRLGHLVTDHDAVWPSGPLDHIAAHYEASERASEYVMSRREGWMFSSDGFGRSEFGPVPTVDESWLVEMPWYRAPAPGTKMIVYNPAVRRALVGAAGYSTDPGESTSIGGVSEEAIRFLSSVHRGPLILGFARDQSLSPGPLVCP